MLALQTFQRDALEEWVRRIQQGADHVVVGIGEAGVVEAHAGGQQAEDFDIAFGFAGGGQGGARQLQVIVSVGEVQVGVLQERGHGEDDVGVVRGVRLELFEHDGEQILAVQAAQYGILVRRDGGGVGVVDHHGLHGRIIQPGERLPQERHIDDAGFAAECHVLQIGPFETGAIQVECLRGGELQSAA